MLSLEERDKSTRYSNRVITPMKERHLNIFLHSPFLSDYRSFFLAANTIDWPRDKTYRRETYISRNKWEMRLPHMNNFSQFSRAITRRASVDRIGP